MGTIFPQGMARLISRPHIYDRYQQITNASEDLYLTTPGRLLRQAQDCKEVNDGIKQPFFLSPDETPHFANAASCGGFILRGVLAGGIRAHGDGWIGQGALGAVATEAGRWMDPIIRHVVAGYAAVYRGMIRRIDNSIAGHHSFVEHR
jgi:hypothetical protein